MSSTGGYYKINNEEARKKFTELTGDVGEKYTTEELIQYNYDMEAYYNYCIEKTVDEAAKEEFLVQHKAKGSPKPAWRERRVNGK